MARQKTTGYNSTYKKLAVQWLNEALCPARAGFSGGRSRTCGTPKSPTSCSRKPSGCEKTSLLSRLADFWNISLGLGVLENESTTHFF